MQAENTSTSIPVNQLMYQKPLIISGPCSAETEQQLLQTALQIKQTGVVDILRAGIWKPRTRPGKFEGIGEEGLHWMQQIKKITNLPVIIEVATAQQVALAMQYDMDMVWIGARTTVNPFSIQEVADALKGQNIPVFIKNPVNPDVELWIGAVERIANAGIQHIGLIHRGFSSYGNAKYRNVPMWHLAIEMKRRYPNLPFIIDPSHISGKRHLIKEIFQNAIDLGYDGAMIESHIHPDEAWSDAQQQITPLQVAEIINHIVWRKENANNENTPEHLLHLRNEIDTIDAAILEQIHKRMKISEAIGVFKKQNNITILQTKRWNEIVAKITAQSEQLGLSNEFIAHYLEAIHIESIRHQDKIMNNNDLNHL